jgi:hypothetical protein
VAREKLGNLPLPRVPSLRLADSPISVTTGHGLGKGRRVVRTWLTSHALDAVLWTLAVALAVVVGVVIARL